MNTRTRPSTTLTRFGQGLGAALERLSPRERRAVFAAAWVVGLGLLWWLALAPALGTLRQAPERHARLDAQLAQMQHLAASAEQLRSLNSSPPPGRAATQRARAQYTSQLGGSAQVSAQGDRASVNFRGTTPEALSQWLNQMRVNARLLPVQAQLERQANPAGWSGQLVLAGPGLQSDE
ncbi:MAG: type II secretion system protein GspM [Variovorax sp.]|nr:type II secretion system protein GspM [Variovorax sp.]